jgi:hypothetical protein
MGYKPKRLEYDLDFTDGELDGLEVTMRSVSLEHYLKASAAHRLSDISRRDWSEDDRKAVEDLYESFASALVSWNVEDEKGDPVPATLEAVFDQDLQFLLPVALVWLQAMTGMDPELGKDSTSGPPFPEASIPMDVSSPNPES